MGRPRELVLRANLKRLASRRLPDNLSLPSGATLDNLQERRGQVQVGGWQQSERDSLSTCQPAAAGVQVCTPTHLLHLSLGWRIAPLPCPPAANSPMLRRPQSPRAFRVPLWHSDSGPSVKHPLPLRR